MKLGIAIPFHLRGHRNNRAYEITMRQYSKLPYTVHYCGSEKDISEPFGKQFGTYVEVPQGQVCTESAGNDILRKKFNDSLATLPKDLDWYCLAGANDIIHPDFFDELELIDPIGIKMAGVAMNEKLFCVDLMKHGEVTAWKLKYIKKLELLPGINCFSRGAMEATSWKPYQRSGCETGAELLIKELGSVVPLKGNVTMMKGRYDLNSMAKIASRHERLKVTDSEVSYLRSLMI